MEAVDREEKGKSRHSKASLGSGGANEEEDLMRHRRRSVRSSREDPGSASGSVSAAISTGNGGGNSLSAYVCSVRSCGAPAAGAGARSTQSLCARHLAEDAARLAEQRASVQRRLRALLGDTAATNAEVAAAERQALVAELTATEASFEAAQSSLVRWHETLIGHLARRLEAATRDDGDAAAAQQYEREIADAERAGGGGQRVFELLTQLELLITGMEERRGGGGRRFFPTQSRGGREDDDDPCTAAPAPSRCSMPPAPPFVGDVSGRVRELHFIISRHLSGTELLCEPDTLDDRLLRGGGGAEDDCGGASMCGLPNRRRRSNCRKPAATQSVDAIAPLFPPPPPPCRLVGCVGDLGGQPLLIAACTNTAGYVADHTGRIARSDEPSLQMSAAAAESVNAASGSSSSSDAGQQAQQSMHHRLPEPCVFVAFEPEERRDHLLLVPLDCLGQGGTQRLRCHCALDWRREVRGLHCDSATQLLYIAQEVAVSVADLSGRLVRVIGGGLGCLTGLDGDPDFAYAFDRQARRLLVVDKSAGGLRAAFPTDSFHGGGHDKLAVLGNKVLLTDWRSGRLHKLCATSGRLVVTYPNARTSRDTFCGLACVAADATGGGLIFVTECERRVVHVLASDGAILQTLGAEGCYCFCIPWGLTIAEVGSAGRRQLVVADNGNHRLVLFELL